MTDPRETRHRKERDGKFSLEERWPDAGRLLRAFMLALSVGVCEALLRGESVPVSRLDPVWMQRLGKR